MEEESIVRKRQGLSRPKLFEKSGMHQLDRRSSYDNLINNSDVNKKEPYVRMNHSQYI